jgi:hypothetical protein
VDGGRATRAPVSHHERPARSQSPRSGATNGIHVLAAAKMPGESPPDKRAAGRGAGLKGVAERAWRSRSTSQSASRALSKAGKMAPARTRIMARS